MNQEDFERFKEIRQEITNLLEEALGLVPRNGITQERAKSYWFGQIYSALTKESPFLGSSMCTMEDTENELETLVDEELEEFDEDDINQE